MQLYYGNVWPEKRKLGITKFSSIITDYAAHNVVKGVKKYLYQVGD